jgi:L-histidine N-alpha-methyltransferase
VAEALTPGDWLLLGADLVKDPARLVAAYDDRAGVTAAFNLNLIDVLNAHLDGDLDSDDFEHVARWNVDQQRIEMWLRARVAVHARFAAIDLDWSLAAGGELLTETSAKFRLPGLHGELRTAGLQPVGTWTDADEDFSVTLARR